MPADSAADSPESDLRSALQRHQIDLPSEQISLLENYCQALWDWNAKVNLTRHTDYDKFVARDVADALVLSRHIQPEERILDVGSGGGAPAVVLAILRPDLTVALSESVGKKARVLADIVQNLGLALPVHHCRAEDVLAAQSFDTLTARAVASLAKLLVWFEPYWGAFDRLLAIKGPGWVEERQEARQRGLMAKLQLRKLENWPLPGTDSESVLLEVRPKS
jgi:16S rRNA (guanine527-N7)-methyltransferase